MLMSICPLAVTSASARPRSASHSTKPLASDTYNEHNRQYHREFRSELQVPNISITPQSGGCLVLRMNTRLRGLPSAQSKIDGIARSLAHQNDHRTVAQQAGRPGPQARARGPGAQMSSGAAAPVFARHVPPHALGKPRQLEPVALPVHVHGHVDEVVDSSIARMCCR